MTREAILLCSPVAAAVHGEPWFLRYLRWTLCIRWLLEGTHKLSGTLYQESLSGVPRSIPATLKATLMSSMILLVAILVAPWAVNAFLRFPCSQLVTERFDP